MVLELEVNVIGTSKENFFFKLKKISRSSKSNSNYLIR